VQAANKQQKALYKSQLREKRNEMKQLLAEVDGHQKSKEDAARELLAKDLLLVQVQWPCHKRAALKACRKIERG